MGYCLYRPQPFEAGPGAESVRSVADSCWSRIKGRDKVELKLGCGNYDPQTPPSTLDSISLKDYPDRLLDCAFSQFRCLHSAPVHLASRNIQKEEYRLRAEISGGQRETTGNIQSRRAFQAAAPKLRQPRHRVVE